MGLGPLVSMLTEVVGSRLLERLVMSVLSLVAVGYAVILILRLLAWVRGDAGQPANYANAVPLGPVTPTESDLFLDRYYLNPDPDGAPVALASSIEAGHFRDPTNPCWYFFAVIARRNPGLLRRYESLFLEMPDGRAVLLKVLQQSGDDETERFLEVCVQDERLKPLRAEIQTALESWPDARIDPLALPVSTPADLDRLWCEFHATGNTKPVVRLIDVLERPDHIRGALEYWLHETAGGGRLGLETIRRKRTIRRLWEQASILCDAERREVLSAQDLDCHCTMQDMCHNKERAFKIGKLLPFSMYGEDAYIMLKVAARWSLASHAYQHPIIFDLCESEAAKRTGRCRVLLLEIVARTALVRQDLEKAFNALRQSLTADPESDLARNTKTAAEWGRLLQLTPDAASSIAEPSPTARETSLRCIDAMEALDTYRTTRIFRKADRPEGGAGDVALECEVARPANLHVFQTMWWESGPVYDEWVTIGNKYFRGPVYVQTKNISEGVDSSLLASAYFTLLRKGKPAEFSVRLFDDKRYWLFEYRRGPIPNSPLWGWLAQSAGIHFFGCDVLVWAEFETARLVKVVQRPRFGERKEITHLFSCYDEPVSIVPPAFSVFQPLNRSMRGRVARWLTGVLHR